MYLSDDFHTTLLHVNIHMKVKYTVKYLSKKECYKKKYIHTNIV